MRLRSGQCPDLIRHLRAFLPEEPRRLRIRFQLFPTMFLLFLHAKKLLIRHGQAAGQAEQIPGIIPVCSSDGRTQSLYGYDLQCLRPLPPAHSSPSAYEEPPFPVKLIRIYSEKLPLSMRNFCPNFFFCLSCSFRLVSNRTFGHFSHFKGSTIRRNPMRCSMPAGCASSSGLFRPVCRLQVFLPCKTHVHCLSQQYSLMIWHVLL